MDEHNSEIINIVQKIDTDLHPKIIFLRKLYFMMFLQTIVAGVVNETVSLCPEFLGLLGKLLILS
jgi:hypothetical protein